MAADPILALRKEAIEAINARLARLWALDGGDPPSQSEIAEHLGLTRPRLNMLMNGKAAGFTLEALLRIALRLDLGVRLKLTRPYSEG